jgi:cell division protein FtsI (penicillin-binding protein 3)
MLTAYNTIANGGVYVAPKLVAATVDANGHSSPTPPSAQHRVVSPQVAQQMTTMLGEVVRVGTGQLGKVSGYTAAGKTGTARVPLPNSRGYMDGVYESSFAGFAPAEHPALTSIVVLDQTTAFGGTVAAPVFSTVVGYGLRQFRVPPPPAQPPAAGVPLATPQSALAASGEKLPAAMALGSTPSTTAASTAAGVAAAKGTTKPTTPTTPTRGTAPPGATGAAVTPTTPTTRPAKH